MHNPPHRGKRFNYDYYHYHIEASTPTTVAGASSPFAWYKTESPASRSGARDASKAVTIRSLSATM